MAPLTCTAQFGTCGRKLQFVLAMAGIAGLLCGCETVRFYGQAIRGQYQIMARRQPFEKVMLAANTPAALKAQLELVRKLREFAEKELQLPVNGQYERYVDVGRRYVVWNVHATPEFSLEPKTWCYPIVGRLKYRGYFSEAGAQRYAATLERKGLEVYIEGVEAYSTLGWFRDPVLNTFIHHAEPELAEIIFHELAHQRIFVSGDTDFDEAFATLVGQEGTRRWLRATWQSALLEQYNVAERREAEFVALVTLARAKLKRVYANSAPRANARSASEALARRKAKAQIIVQLREDYAQLKARWDGFAGYDSWFAQTLNNAQLNTVATYYDLVPAFQELLERNEGDLKRFYLAVQRISRTPKQQRHDRLREQAGLLEPPRHSSPRAAHPLVRD